MKLSVIITAKDRKDQKLKDLEWSIKQQTFKDYEVLIITEGNSETAKAIGLKRAKGEIVCILASDNYLNDTEFFEKCLSPFKEKEIVGVYPSKYFYYREDDILNRYFALFGVNDPVPLYLGKNDRLPYYQEEFAGYPLDIWGDGNYLRIDFDDIPTLGDNGFFIRRKILMQADIEHYFHIDVCQDLFEMGYRRYAMVNTSIWHRTGGNVFKFFAKRFRYADKLSQGRRWHMVERKDLPRLLWFIFSTITLVYPLYLSFKGYRKVKDIAWFLHLPICWAFLILYGILFMKKLLRI